MMCHEWSQKANIFTSRAVIDPLQPRPMEPPEAVEVMAVPTIGGCHHHDARRAACCGISLTY
jgi:hypothetical protein